MAEPIPAFPVARLAWESQGIDLSGDGTGSVDQVWVVTYADDEIAAMLAALSASVPIYRTFGRSAVSVESREGETTWKIRISYSSQQSKPITGVTPNIEDPEVTYQLSGETRHITEALSTRVKTASGLLSDVLEAAPYARLIGAKKDGVDGADIPVPIVSFSETHYFLRKDLTRAVRRKWEKLFARTNHEEFRGYEAGEVAFLGAQTTIKGGDNFVVPVTFNFQRRENLYEQDLGGIEVDVIEGWELVDMRYRDEVNGTTHTLEKTPDRVHLHRVLHRGDFADLGISTL